MATLTVNQAAVPHPAVAAGEVDFRPWLGYVPGVTLICQSQRTVA